MEMTIYESAIYDIGLAYAQRPFGREEAAFAMARDYYVNIARTKRERSWVKRAYSRFVTLKKKERGEWLPFPVPEALDDAQTPEPIPTEDEEQARVDALEWMDDELHSGDRVYSDDNEWEFDPDNEDYSGSTEHCLAAESSDWLVALHIPIPPELKAYRRAWELAKDALHNLCQENKFTLAGELQWQQAFRACMTAFSAYYEAEQALYAGYAYSLNEGEQRNYGQQKPEKTEGQIDAELRQMGWYGGGEA